jgi:hypothetical protein
MATTNLIRFGSNAALASPTPSDLWLPVYGGEVLTAFQEYNQFTSMVNHKTLTSGTTMKFPATWKIGSEYHEAGTELLGLDVETKEYSISLDDRPLVSHFEVDDIDVAMSHFDTRNELASECGRELARQMDRKIAALLINASRTTADTGTNSFPIGTSGATFYPPQADFDETNWGLEQNGAQLVEAIGVINQKMDEQDVPSNDRCCVVNVALFYALRKMGLPYYTSGLVNQTGAAQLWGRADTGTSGPKLQDGVGYGTAIDVMGIPVYMSNHVPSTNITTGPTKYQGNFAKVGGVVFQKQAIAALTLMGIQTEKFRDVRRQSDFMVSKMLMGGGALRPYCAYTLEGT